MKNQDVFMRFRKKQIQLSRTKERSPKMPAMQQPCEGTAIQTATRGQKSSRIYPRIFPLFGGLGTIFEKEKQFKYEKKLNKDVGLKHSHLP